MFSVFFFSCDRVAHISCVNLFRRQVSIEGKAGDGPDGIIAIDGVYLYKICLLVPSSG